MSLAPGSARSLADALILSNGAIVWTHDVAPFAPRPSAAERGGPSARASSVGSERLGPERVRRSPRPSISP